MISYKKLRLLMVEKEMTWQELIKGVNVSQDVGVKLRNDKYVSIFTLEKICTFLEVDIGEIVSFSTGINNRGTK